HCARARPLQAYRRRCSRMCCPRPRP
ncbi:hypothetical protein BN1708_018823, partial [Verticillium longisporum]